MPKIKRTNDEWRTLLAEQRDSGQTQQDWCAANGINLHTLRDRSSRLKRQDREAADHTDRHDTISAGWVEVKAGRLKEVEQLTALETKSDKHLPAAKEVSPAHESGATETASRKKPVDISLTRGKWTVTVRADFETGLLVDVLRAVNQVCC